jgi:ribulose-5-phosphate 4-epimerase/fuculose-1-phosphate aldolase
MGFVLHSAVLRARPDVNAVVHIHEESSTAVSVMKDGLLPLCQDAIFLFERVGYHDYQGITEDAAERDQIVANLGDHPVMLLRSHGSVTVGAAMQDAYNLTNRLVKASKIQLQLMAAGGELVIPSPEVCRHAVAQHKAHNQGRGQADWPGLVRDMDKLDDSYRT